MNGVDHHWGQPALQSEQQAFETGVIVDDVETLAGHSGIDAREIGCLASRFRPPTEIGGPGAVGQHGYPLRCPLRSEYGDVMSQAAQLEVEQMDDELGAAV